MTWQLPAMAGAGALIGFGVWSLLSPPGDAPSLAARRAGAARRFVAGPGGARVAAAVAAGVTILVVTRWVAVAAAVAGVVIAWPRLFGAAAEQRVVITRLESLAAWVESLRDVIASGRALPEALPAASARPYPGLEQAMADVVSRMSAHEPLERVLRRLADDIDDAVADRAIAALVLNARVQGRRLQTVLTGLAASTRREVDARRQVEAERRRLRRGVQIIMVAVVVMSVAMATSMQGFSAAYSSATGQVVLAVVVALFLGGLMYLRSLSTHTTPQRFLVQTHPKAPGAHLAARYALPTSAPHPRPQPHARPGSEPTRAQGVAR